MSAPIEKVNNNSNAVTGEIIKRVEKSERDKNKNEDDFSEALNEKMKEDLKKKKKPKDRVELTERNQDDKNAKDIENSASDNTSSSESNNDGKEDSEEKEDSQQEHIDIKA